MVWTIIQKRYLSVLFLCLAKPISSFDIFYFTLSAKPKGAISSTDLNICPTKPAAAIQYFCLASPKYLKIHLKSP